MGTMTQSETGRPAAIPSTASSMTPPPAPPPPPQLPISPASASYTDPSIAPHCPSPSPPPPPPCPLVVASYTAPADAHSKDSGIASHCGSRLLAHYHTNIFTQQLPTGSRSPCVLTLHRQPPTDSPMSSTTPIAMVVGAQIFGMSPWGGGCSTMEFGVGAPVKVAGGAWQPGCRLSILGWLQHCWEATTLQLFTLKSSNSRRG